MLISRNQCKFFYDKDSPNINGTCNCANKCSIIKKIKKNNKCDIVSFMILNFWKVYNC